MKRELITACALVIATNGAVLFGVWKNRSGPLTNEIELSERELMMSNTGRDNSGITLRLQWWDDRHLIPVYPSPGSLVSHGGHRGFAVLELGPRKPRADPKTYRAHESSLTVVNDGLDPNTLRKQYSDRAKFLIVPCVSMGSRVARLLVAEIYVPHEFRSLFDPLRTVDSYQHLMKEGSPPPRYFVTLRYGSRYEPWIVSVRLAKP